MLKERILESAIPEPNTGCWLWDGAVSTEGYGRVGNLGYAHRIAWITFRGPIPDGNEIDHLCRTRACCNPDHLEPVTRSENIRRGALAALWRNKTHCPRGHAYDAKNTYVDKRGFRHCRRCSYARLVIRRARCKG